MLTPDEIRAAIAASPELLALVPDTVALSAALSEGRTKLVPTEVGKGAILDAFGLDDGNAFLDMLYSEPRFRHVKDLVSSSTLDITNSVVIENLALMVGAGVLTQSQVDALMLLATVDDPVPEFDVRRAIFADDGTLLVGGQP